MRASSPSSGASSGYRPALPSTGRPPPSSSSTTLRWRRRFREGKLCLSSVIEVARVLTPENVAEVLPRFFGLSSRDAAAVAASIRPIEDPPEREVVTPIRLITPAPKVAAAFAPSVQESAAALHEGHAAAANGPRLEVRAPEAAAAQTVRTPDMLAAGPCTMTEPRPTLEPLDAERARLHITVSRRLLAKLEAALDLLLAQREKRMGIVDKPRKAAALVRPETIPAAVKRGSGNGPAAAVSGRSTRAASVAPRYDSSSITSRREPWADPPRSTIFESRAGSTTSSPHVRHSARSGWLASNGPSETQTRTR